MRYTKVVIICLLLVKPTAFAQDRAIPVSLIQLIATPEKFNGKLVTVQGILGLGEFSLLWVHEEDAKNLLTANSVRVSPTPDMNQNKDKLDHMYVTLSGIFRAAHGGIESYEGGAIIQIRSCVIWSDPRQPIGEKERPVGRYK
jgi:hypothetical protein